MSTASLPVRSDPPPGPQHVAIIMDGNGRWAKARGLPRVAGHRRGADAVRRVVRGAGELGIPVLTLFAFSTENWARPVEEVNDLMGLLRHYLRSELEELHRKYAAKGVEVLGFPCNQFGAQEPGNADEIKNFCSLTYDVTFPMFAKVDVNGANAHPLYDYLTRQKGGGLLGRAIKWNFTKFLIGRDGKVLRRFPPTTKPEALDSVIERAL